MRKEEKTLIKQARKDMDETVISEASFRIQSILEEVFQKGIEVGETIGYTGAIMENARETTKKCSTNTTSIKGDNK